MRQAAWRQGGLLLGIGLAAGCASTPDPAAVDAELTARIDAEFAAAARAEAEGREYRGSPVPRPPVVAAVPPKVEVAHEPEPAPAVAPVASAPEPAPEPAEPIPDPEPAQPPEPEPAPKPAPAVTVVASAPPVMREPTPPPASLTVPLGSLNVVGRIESMQPPAWIERMGARAGARPGWGVDEEDRLSTGARGRLTISLADGYRLQLGANSRMEVEPGDGGVVYRLLKGTAYFAPSISTAEQARVGIGRETTALLAGGEAWLGASGTTPTLWLIKGSADVRGPNGLELRMTQPQTVLSLPAGGAFKLRPADGAARSGMRQVEALKPRPLLTANGEWTVALASRGRPAKMRKLACNLQEKGIPTEVLPVEHPQGPWERLVVRRFASRTDAQAFLPDARAAGFPDAWLIQPSSP